MCDLPEEGEFSDDFWESIMARCKQGALIPVLCEQFFCPCRGQGNQECVEHRVNELDERSGGTSPLLAEIPYNMLVSPPRPMFSTERSRRGAGNWRYKSHPEHPEGFVSKSGHVAIPDLVFMDEGAGRPEGKNLLAVIEMKFPGDPNGWASDNMAMREPLYRRIAHENNPDAEYIRIDESICQCPQQRQPEPRTAPVPAPSTERARRPKPAPSPAPPEPAFQQVLDVLGGTAEILGGAALFLGSTAASGVLIADDATGVGVVDDVALPATIAGMGAGTALVADGIRRLGRAFGF